VVDDEPALTKMLQKQLERLNYQITTSNSPREAVTIFQANPSWYDLVITDLTMPEINGVEVARQIHALRPETPIIVISGHHPSLNDAALESAGIRALVEKPVPLAGLAEQLQRIFNPEPGNDSVPIVGLATMICSGVNSSDEREACVGSIN